MKVFHVVFLILLVQFILGCTHVIVIDIDPEPAQSQPALDDPIDVAQPKSVPIPRPKPVLQPVPLSVGIYYSDELKNFEYVRGIPDIHWVVPIGENSVKAFRTVMPELFTSVIELAESELFARDDVDIIIEPAIEEFHFRLGSERHSNLHSIVYRFNIYQNNGIPLRVWRVHGQREFKLGIFQVVWGHIEGDLEDAIDNMRLQSKSVFDDAFIEVTKKQSLPNIPSAIPDGIEIHSELQQSMALLNMDKELPGNVAVFKVSIHNQSGRDLILRGSETRLLLPNGHWVSPSGATQLIARILGPVDVGIVAITVVDALTSMMHEFSQSQERMSLLKAQVTQLRSQQLRKTLIPQGTSVAGLLSYLPVAGTPAFSHAHLQFWLYDKKTYEAYQVRVPITDVNFKGVTDKETLRKEL